MPYTKLSLSNYPYEIFVSDNGPPLSRDKGSIKAGGIFNGDYNPSWRDQVKAGINAGTAASGTVTIIKPGFLDLFGRVVAKPQFGGADLWSGGLTGIPPCQGLDPFLSVPPASVVTEVNNRSIRKFLDSADEIRSSIEFGQDLGEWKETLHGLISPMKTLKEFTLTHLSNVLKQTKKLKSKHSLSKVVADSWLEYRFGWRPLALDIGQAYASFTNNRNHLDVSPIKSSAKGNWSIYNGPVSGYVAGLGSAGCNLRVTGEYTNTFKGALRTGAVNGRIGSMQALQLDLPHFLPTIWDLLPYSWIADYFVNIGDMIRAASFNANNLSWGNHTTRTSNIYEYNWNWRVDNFSTTFYELADLQTAIENPSAVVTSFTRGPISTAALIPELRFSFPLGSERPWENMAALLASRQDDITRSARNIR